MTAMDTTGREQVIEDINQENEMKSMLQQSIAELEATCADLEQRVGTIDEESNEWKTRYETQCEVNRQLQSQLAGLQHRAEEGRQQLDEIRKPRPQNIIDADNQKFTKAYISRLERDKAEFDNQLRDLGWRLDQESKAYHKANEERKQYVMEINFAKDQIERIRRYPQSPTTQT